MKLSTAVLLMSLTLCIVVANESTGAVKCMCTTGNTCLLNYSLRSPNVPPNSLFCPSNNKHFEYIVILHFNETSLPANIFDKFTNLKSMEFYHGSIERIKPGAFEAFSYLTMLIITENNISSLEHFTFHGLNALKALAMHHNILTSIAPNAFDGLEHLTNLILSNNKLTQLPEKIFDTLPMLKVLSLSKNLLTYLPDSLFDNIWFLAWLDVSHNQLHTFHFPNLKVVRLSLHNNLLTRLHINDHVKFVQAHHNHIRSMMGTGRNVTELWLNDNAISDVTSISRMANLTKLILNNNPLQPNSGFASLTSLNQLMLRNTSIQISENTFANLSSMALLDLSYNNSTQLDFRMFSSMIDLETLVAAHNRIQMINFIELRLYLPKLRILEICGNGWNATYMKHVLLHMKHHKLEGYPGAYSTSPSLQSFFFGLCSTQPLEASIEESDYMLEDYSDVLEEEFDQYYPTSSPSTAQMWSQTVTPIHTSTTANTETSTPSKEDSGVQSTVAVSLNDTNTVPLMRTSPRFVTSQVLVCLVGLVCLVVIGYYVHRRRFVVRRTTPVDLRAILVSLV